MRRCRRRCRRRATGQVTDQGCCRRRKCTPSSAKADFRPLGIPQQRGLIYTISVIDRGGDDGRLVIDARSGRIIRFIPAYRMGDNFNGDLDVAYGPVGPLPPPTNSSYRRAPRPPLPIPHVASRSAAPLPKAAAKCCKAGRAAGAAIGCNGQTSRAAGIGAITHGRRGKTFGADHADAGNARRAGVLIMRRARAMMALSRIAMTLTSPLLTGESVGRLRRPFLLKKAEAKLRLWRIGRCEAGEGPLRVRVRGETSYPKPARSLSSGGASRRPVGSGFDLSSTGRGDAIRFNVRFITRVEEPPAVKLSGCTTS